jgi:hypothetical protein
MLKKLKKVAARAKDETQYTLIGDTGRSFFHKLNNLIGSDRPLYHGQAKYTYTDADASRWGRLAARTKIELERAKFIEAKRVEAIGNRANTDALNVQANSQIAKALSYVEGVRLQGELEQARITTALEGKRREISLLLEADEQAAQQAKWSQWQTVDTQAQTVGNGQSQGQWGDV